MKRLLTVSAMTIAVLTLAWGGAVLAGQSAGPGQKPATADQQTGQKPPEQKPPEQKSPEQKPIGQKPATPAQPPAPEQTPEQKAFSEASRTADLDKRIEALRTFMTDFPKSRTIENAENAILSALIRKTTDDVKKVQDQAKKFSGMAAESARGNANSSVAGMLLNANILLDEAETYAQKGLAAMADEKAYIDAQKKAYDERMADRRKQDPKFEPGNPPDFAATYKSTHQTMLLTLAQVFDKRGKLPEAEKAFKDVYQAQTKGAAAATAAVRLADFAKKAGRDQEQVEYLTVVALAGRLTKETRADLETVYKKAHGGSIDGLEEMLDQRYKKDGPNPVKATPYVAGKTRTDRVVLGEIFTGAGCPPCVGPDLAYEGALKRYKPQELAVLMYHLHIPRPDPMTNPSTQARAKFYKVNAVPTSALNGVPTVGGGNAESAPKFYADKIEPVVDKALTTKADIRLKLQATMAGQVISVKADVGKPTVAAKNLTLQIALVEEQVRYSGENGVRFHPMVVRSLGGKDALGFPIAPGKALQVTESFDIVKVAVDAFAHLDKFEADNVAKPDAPAAAPGQGRRFPDYKFVTRRHQVDPAKLAVVAFVQDGESKKVLQVAYVKVGPAAAKPAR